MRTICTFIRSAISPRNFQSLLASIITPGGYGSGSDDKNNDTGKTSGKEDSWKPCPCCQRPGDSNPSTPTLYDSRKYGHCLPSNTAAPNFDTLPYVPNGIFRCTAGEVLGQGAAKGYCYQCPEYFSYQHMTYYDMHLILRSYHHPCSKTGRKP